MSPPVLTPLVPEDGRADVHPRRPGPRSCPAPFCPDCQDSLLVDTRTGMAWPMLLASDDPALHMEIEEGLTAPRPCPACAADGQHRTDALDRIRRLRRDGAVMVRAEG